MKPLYLKSVATVAISAIVALGISTPSQAIRAEHSAANGDAVVSLNQTDQKAIIGGGIAAAALIASGPLASIGAGVLTPYLTDAGTCPGDQARYISFKDTKNTAGSTITNSWCH